LTFDPSRYCPNGPRQSESCPHPRPPPAASIATAPKQKIGSLRVGPAQPETAEGPPASHPPGAAAAAHPPPPQGLGAEDVAALLRGRAGSGVTLEVLPRNTAAEAEAEAEAGEADGGAGGDYGAGRPPQGPIASPTAAAGERRFVTLVRVSDGGAAAAAAAAASSARADGVGGAARRPGDAARPRRRSPLGWTRIFGGGGAKRAGPGPA
jgi:hypothetical protein